MQRFRLHPFTGALALSLAAGLAGQCAAQVLEVVADGSALTLNGNSAQLFDVPFRAVRDDTKKTITFYFKGDLNFHLVPSPVRFTVQNAVYPVRFVVGNDAIFTHGLELVAGTAGAGKGGTPGTGGAVSPGLPGDTSTGASSGGQGGSADCAGRHTDGITGEYGGKNFAAGTPIPGVAGTRGGDGSFGVNQNVSFGGAGIGGAAGAGAVVKPATAANFSVAGGAGGAYGFSSGENGKDGEWGASGPAQPPSNPGSAAGDASSATNPLNNFLFPILVGGNGGGAGGGGGGGGPGNGGKGGTQGGGGGGGGSTFCNDGGKGGNGGGGGGGRAGGNSGAGGDGQPGASGGGAVEFTALGRLIVNNGDFNASGAGASVDRIPGTQGLAGDAGFPGGAGGSGQVVSNPAGNGGNGGPGGFGGASGAGGNGGDGGLGSGGSGGTVFLSATELTVSGTFTVQGGTSASVAGRAGAGRIIVGANHVLSTQLTANPQADNGPQFTLPGMAPDASQASPYIGGGPTVPYIAGLVSGAAVAGVIPGLQATSRVNPATLPRHTVAALLMLDTDVPGITYDKTKYRAMLFLNYSPSPDFQLFVMGIGVPGYSNVLNTYGWANDARFGGINGPQNIQALGDAVYVSLVPIAQPNQNIARVGGYFRNRENTSVEILFTDSTTFGVGTSKMVTVVRPGCDADFNDDGFLTFEDFDAFVGAFESGFASADFNQDGFLSFEDFDAFVTSFEAGC